VKVGDLVKHAEGEVHTAPYLDSWLGIVLGFDEDDDPIIQWFEDGSQPYPASPELRSEVKVI